MTFHLRTADLPETCYRRHVNDPYAAARRTLEDSVLCGPGKAPSSVREAVAALKDVPDELRELVEKIEKHAYAVTDEDVDKLKTKYTDDQLFEIVVATAIGASRRRLEAGMRALEEA
jgi:hypothetical protein